MYAFDITANANKPMPVKAHACQEHRIAWTLNGAAGAGLWHGDLQKERLASAVAVQNGQYGEKSHWLESRAA
jgi:hypothetical protein